MSEVTELTESFSKLLREKPILMVEISGLERTRNKLRKDVGEVEAKLTSIYEGIEHTKKANLLEIQTTTNTQKRVIDRELARMNDCAEVNAQAEKQIAKTTQEQNQKSNELRGVAQNLLEKERNLIKKESDLKIKENELNDKDTDITIKLSKIEGYIREIRKLLAEDKSMKVELKNLEESLKNTGIEVKQKEEKLKSDEKGIKLEQNILQKRKKELDDRQSELDRAWQEYNHINTILSKRKKDLEDKERAFEAEKAEVALLRAKANVKREK